MKNRKLFAIITLVAFMLTMMPMMAFATTASGSSISVDDASAKVVEVKDGKVTVDSLHLVVDLDSKVKDENQFVIIFAERNGSLSDADYFKVGAEPTESYTGTWEQYISNVTQGYAVLPVEAVGEEDIYVFSKNAGTVTFKAYVIGDTFDAKKIASYYNGSTDLLKAGLVGNGVTGKFNPENTDIKADVTIDADGTEFKLEGIAGDAAVIPVDNNAGDEEQNTLLEVASNNGVDYFDFSIKFTKGGSKLVGEDVTITIDKIGATVNKEEITTSATGKADFKVSASKPGTYVVTVECGSFSQEFKVKFVGTSMTKADFSYVVDGTIATEEIEEKAMKFDVFDGNGNKISATAANTTGDGEGTFAGTFEVEVTSAPEDSALEDDQLADEVTNYNGQYVLDFEPDMPGTYTIKVYNKVTGVSDIATIKADEFGTIDYATISYPSSTYALGGQTPDADVYVYDKNGVKKQGSNEKFSYTGLGVASFGETTGQITFKSGSEYAGKEVVVSVVTNNKYAASTTLTIGAAPASINFETVNAEAGEEVTVTGQVVDVNGNKAAISADGDYTVDVQSAIVVERPAGAIVSVDYAGLDQNALTKQNFLEKGVAPIKVASNTEGTVKVNLVVKLTATDDMIVDGVLYDEDTGNAYTYYLSGVATVAVGETTADVEDANDIVTFIIGSSTFIANNKATTSDVAPYIVDGRTFIPVRAFVEATGASVEFDAATQVVTITGDGIDAQMTIGSNILTVNGETVVMDTAAAIKDGRTVLPVRYAGQAIGYDFECAYGANGAVTAVTMFK